MLASITKLLRDSIIIILVTFLLGEVVLRVVNWTRPSYVFHDASHNRFRGRPGSLANGFELNSLGFMDLEVNENRGDAFRVLGLGDSFAFGIVPYEHNYLTLLEEHLGSAHRAVEVVNMGIPRTGPRDYLSVLVEEGLELEPDLVLVSFYVGNDFLDSLRAGRTSKKVWERSYVLTLLRFAFFVRPGLQAGVLYGQAPYVDDAPTMGRKKYLEIEQRRSRIYQSSWAGLDDALASTLRYLEGIQAICRRQGATLTVVVFPEETQLDVSLQRELAAARQNQGGEDLDFLLPTRLLREGLRALEIDTLDLYEPFRLAAQSELLYKPNDSHLNIAGNRLAAELIAAHLAPLITPEITDTPEP